MDIIKFVIHFFSILNQLLGIFNNKYIIPFCYSVGLNNVVWEPRYYKTTDFKESDIFLESVNFIPKKIYFCYENKNINNYIIEDIKKQNPEWEVFFYDDKECSEFIHSHIGDKMGNLFDRIKDGPIKADLFRICILYFNGGVYSDIDHIFLKPINEIINIDATFGLGASLGYDKGMFINPAFMFSTQKNKILEETIQLYEDVISKEIYKYWDYSIVYSLYFILKKYIKGIKNESCIVHLKEQNQKIQFYREDYKFDVKDIINCIRSINCSLMSYIYFINEKNQKIICVHRPEYNSKNHSFY